MTASRIDQFNKAVELRKKSTEKILEYWVDYSIFTTLEFWILLAMLIVPLIVLILKIDRTKIFLIGFYGYSVHIASFYTNLLGVNLGLWNYPIQLIPPLPSFALDSSLVPVTFMLGYQWTINKKKNYYLTIAIISACFAFIFEPLLVKMQLIMLYGKMSHFYSFVIYFVLGLFAKFVANVFLLLGKKAVKPAKVS
jgi:hypothetical protein